MIRSREPGRCISWLAVVLLAACGTAGEPSVPGGSPVPVSEGPAVEGVATLQSVRTARHDGFDRVVFEFSGAGLPGYAVERVERPVIQCGSGREVPVEGAALIEVRFEPAAAHDEEGRATVAERSRRPGLPVLRQLTLTCDFEAHVDWVLGLSAPVDARVRTMAGPPRLVVDLPHAAGGE